MRITKHICPRNCYDTCGMLAHVNEQGKLIKVAGDPNHDNTQGKLCCKGYAYTHYVYHPCRLTYPMLQSPRFSGQWHRISWTDAFDMIGRKIIDLRDEYDSFLPIALLKGSGNHGVLAEAIEGVLSSMGSITRATGSLCLSAGWDAQLLDFGGIHSQEPRDMEKANLLILWGINPGATAIHQIPIIQKMRKNGGKVVLIDVLPTATAKFSDEFIQVRPGGDGALALALLHELVVKNLVDYTYIKEKTVGWELYCHYLLQTNIADLESISGVDSNTVSTLAEQIASGKPVAFWPGTGLQRYANGGQNMRAIDALVAASGNLDLPGGGIFFQNINFWRLNHRVFMSGLGSRLHDDRLVGVNALARNLENCGDPPVKLLWFTSSNFMARGSDLDAMKEQMTKMELTITTEHFLTSTAEVSDLVLPATTCFESPDLVIGHWHNRIGLNQQAIEPVGECRSELEIAKSLSRVLNSIRPDICPFPQSGPDEAWLEGLSPWLKEHAGIASYRDLLSGARPLDFSKPGEGKLYATTTGKFQFQAISAMDQGCPEIPVLVTPLHPPTSYPFRFLVLHCVENLNSQFSYLDWINRDEQSEVWVSTEVARRKGIEVDETLIVYNEQGEIRMKAKIKADVPNDTLICYTWYDLFKKPVNGLMAIQETDFGQALTNYKGVAYHDTFVNFTRG